MVYKMYMRKLAYIVLAIGSLLLVACAAPAVSDQFWWNWWANAIVGLGALLAVLVALFGEWFRSKFFAPILRMRLLSAEGEKGKFHHADSMQNGKGERDEDGRFYHLRVWNERRLISPARDVQVFLTRVEEPGPDGKLQPIWFGEIPMTWRNQQISALTQTIGHERDCDLCSVGKEGTLSLALLIFPLVLKARFQGQFIRVVSLQARSNQADSPICRIKIAWDGVWEAGDSEMRRHLVISEEVSA